MAITSIYSISQLYEWMGYQDVSQWFMLGVETNSRKAEEVVVGVKVDAEVNQMVAVAWQETHFETVEVAGAEVEVV